MVERDRRARRNPLNLETTKPETEFRNDAFPAEVLGSESLYQLANLIVIAGCNENHPTALHSKRQSNVQSNSALKIILSQSPNAQARVQVRFAETGARRIDHASNLPAARLRPLADLRPKRL
jgi:hypothetical protein